MHTETSTKAVAKYAELIGRQPNEKQLDCIERASKFVDMYLPGRRVCQLFAKETQLLAPRLSVFEAEKLLDFIVKHRILPLKRVQVQKSNSWVGERPVQVSAWLPETNVVRGPNGFFVPKGEV